MPQGDYYVTKRANGTWAVKAKNSEKAYRLFDTKAEAEQFVRSLKSAHSVTSHDRDGRFKGKTTIRNKKEEDNNCFLTTACVSYFNLSDNCKQLTILRHFRDNFLMLTNEGKEQVKEYYKLAPLVVNAINKQKNKSSIYKKLFKKINIACNLIEQNQLLKAASFYKDISTQLYSQLITK